MDLSRGLGDVYKRQPTTLFCVFPKSEGAAVEAGATGGAGGGVLVGVGCANAIIGIRNNMYSIFFISSYIRF
jgi:hypothetical protein